MHVERADYHLALCREACEVNGADVVERFFAHGCSVHAAPVACSSLVEALHRTRMAELLLKVQDADLKAFCEATGTLASTPP